MADRIRFAVSATPIETLTDENGGIRDILASEILHSLSGSGESISLTDYSGLVANQGYKDGAVEYKSASHLAGGTILTQTNLPDFIFVKNTGFKYSDATTLGISTTDCISVVIKVAAQSSLGNAGWMNYTDSVLDHYLEIAWLKSGQAILLPAGGASLSISQFGLNTNDFSPLGGIEPVHPDQGIIGIYVRTFQSDGSAAASANAVEFLAVT